MNLPLTLRYPLTLQTFSHKSFSDAFFPLLPLFNKKGVVPTLTGGAGTPSVVVLAVFLEARRGPAPHRAVTDRSVSTWACRSCSPAPTRWRSSVTWAQRTLPRASGWVSSSGAPKARMTAPWAAAVTSAVEQATACWCVPAASPTAESTVHAW